MQPHNEEYWQEHGRAALLHARRQGFRSLITDVSPHSLRATKRQIAIDATHNDPGRSVRDAQARLEQMSTEPDYHEAITAFIERRPPRWNR